ncbi:MAG: hypothetical protein AAF915_15400 [Cyanobacteria bacterium P01_D01_bin.50]
MSNSESGNNNDSNTNNYNDPSQPEYWENLGIKPIVVDENDPNYIEKVTDQVTERINQIVEEFKKDK